MAEILTCSACGKNNQHPNRFCTSCGTEFEQPEDAYTTEPLDTSLICQAENVVSPPAEGAPFMSQSLAWEINGHQRDEIQRDEIQVIMQTLAEASTLWQWLWYYYGQLPAPEASLDTSLLQLLARLIENNRVRQDALHNLLIMELRSHR